MKKILLIGKLNKTIQNLNACLSQKFSVQLCSDSLELVRGMIKIARPDMVIISVIELNGTGMEIFDFFKNMYSGIPVLVIGTSEECYYYNIYFKSAQFERYLKPISSEKLLSKCCERLHINDTNAVSNDLKKENTLKEARERKRILIVDDSSLALRSTKAMLDNKYNVVVATSGEKALDVIRKKHPDLILLDYEMPGCDGRMTLEMIREDKEISDIPVIFLTAVADKEHIAAVLHLNPAGYFLKPLQREKVLQAIEKVFG